MIAPTVLRSSLSTVSVPMDFFAKYAVKTVRASMPIEVKAKLSRFSG